MPDQVELYIAPVEQHDAGFKTGGDASKALKRATSSFKELGEAMVTSANAMFASLNASPVVPDELELEMSVALEAEGKWVVVSAKANATAKIRLKWQKGKPTAERRP